MGKKKNITVMTETAELPKDVQTVIDAAGAGPEVNGTPETVAVEVKKRGRAAVIGVSFITGELAKIASDVELYHALLKCFREGRLDESKVNESLIVARKWAARVELAHVERVLEGGDEMEMELLAKDAKANLAPLFSYVKVFKHREHADRDATASVIAHNVERLSLVVPSRREWNAITKRIWERENPGVKFAAN